MTEGLGSWRKVTPWLRGVLTVLAVVAVAFALREALADAESVPWPSLRRLLSSGLLMGVAVATAGLAWGRLLQGPPLRLLLPSFATAQLAKYIPGSIWQGVGQVLGAEALGVGRGRASMAFVLQLWTQLVAAMVVAALALVTVSTWLVGAGALLVVGLALGSVVRPVLIRLPRLVPSRLEARFSLLRRWRSAVPAQRSITDATVLGAASIVFAGMGYAALLVDPILTWSTVIVVSAFGAAWVAGFLLVPLPAGLGVREFVLLFLLSGSYGGAEVLTAAVVYRAVTVPAELGLVAAAMLLRASVADEPTAG